MGSKKKCSQTLYLSESSFFCSLNPNSPYTSQILPPIGNMLLQVKHFIIHMLIINVCFRVKFQQGCDNVWAQDEGVQVSQRHPHHDQQGHRQPQGLRQAGQLNSS